MPYPQLYLLEARNTRTHDMLLDDDEYTLCIYLEMTNVPKQFTVITMEGIKRNDFLGYRFKEIECKEVYSTQALFCTFVEKIINKI